jgi:hypothetical protein
VKLKSEVLNLRSELNSVKEIMKILREDQNHLFSKVVNIENMTVKSENLIISSTVKPKNKDHHLINWKLESSSKRQSKSRTTMMQQFKIPLIVSRYAILENLQDMNQVPNSFNTKTNPKINKTKTTKKTSNVLIIGDSHTRGCTSNLLNYYGESLKTTKYYSNCQE